MNKGYALLEVMLSAMIIFTSIHLIFITVAAFPIRKVSVSDSLWDRLNEGCDYACALAKDSP